MTTFNEGYLAKFKAPGRVTNEVGSVMKSLEDMGYNLTERQFWIAFSFYRRKTKTPENPKGDPKKAARLMLEEARIVDASARDYRSTITNKNAVFMARTKVKTNQPNRSGQDRSSSQ